MKTFISNLGFDTTQLNQCLFDYGLEEGDHIIILRPNTNDQRGEEAVKQIKNMITNLNKNISFNIVKLNHENFNQSSSKIVELLRNAEGELIVNLGGGDRFILTALVIATMTIQKDNKTITLFSDVNRKRKEIDLPEIPRNLTENQQKILKVIKKGKNHNNKTLAQKTNLSKSTVSRTVKELENKKYIKTRQKGRKKIIKPRILTKLIQI